MVRDLQGLKVAKTFTPSDKPPGRKARLSRWTFKWKSNPFGEVAKAKATLVARGFSQTEGVDYFQKLSPTPAASTIRLVAVAAAAALENNFDLFHFDAEQAFVQSKLDTDVYMRTPDGCGELSGKVVLLNRSLYGLKQSARTWLDLLISTLQASTVSNSRCLNHVCCV